MTDVGAIFAEHVPIWPEGLVCRSCRFVYSDLGMPGVTDCPATMLARLGLGDIAESVRVTTIRPVPVETRLDRLEHAIRALADRVSGCRPKWRRGPSYGRAK